MHVRCVRCVRARAVRACACACCACVCTCVHVRCARAVHARARAVRARARARAVRARAMRARAVRAVRARAGTGGMDTQSIHHGAVPACAGTRAHPSSILAATSRRRGARLARSAPRDDRCALTAQSRPVRGLDQAPRRLGDFSGPNSQDRLEGSCGFALNTLGTTRRRPWILTAQRWPERRCVSLRTGTKKLRTTRDHQSR